MGSLERNQEIFKEFIHKYRNVFLKSKELYEDDKSENGFYSFLNFFKSWLYNSIHNELSPNKFNDDYEKTIRVYCGYIVRNILPVCRKKISYYNKISTFDKHVYLNKWLDLEDDFCALACYRDLKLLALYLERGKKDKLWSKTIHLFGNFFEYSQRLVFGEKIEKIRASYFPGAGKTYAANILCAFWWGYDSEMSILRITYSEDLCGIFIKQISEIIDSKQYRKVFPQFDKGDRPGSYNSELYSKFSVTLGFQFTFSSVMNFYAATRDGQTTGKRGKVLIIDDLTKGADEAYDDRLHIRMKNKFDTEWASRADSSYQPVIALGTMWSNLDLLNEIYKRALKNTDNNIKKDPKYKYTEIAYNDDNTVNSVFISTPILDYDTGESTCPLRYETKKMLEKRDEMDEALWNAVYQQAPTPPKDFLFAYNNLVVWDDETYPLEEMKNNPTQAWAYIDPNRTGNDSFAMGIFKRYKMDNKWSKWYLVDCLCEPTPTEEMLPLVVNKIITHKIERLGFESNVDQLLGSAIKSKKKDMGYDYYSLKIEGFYSTDNKEQRIFNASGGMKREIVYPSIRQFSSNSSMGKGMDQLTSWNANLKYGKHDDFPDMVAMFVIHFCDGNKNKNTIKVLDRSSFGI